MLANAEDKISKKKFSPTNAYVRNVELKTCFGVMFGRCFFPHYHKITQREVAEMNGQSN
jgi:hypothetical protein